MTVLKKWNLIRRFMLIKGFPPSSSRNVKSFKEEVNRILNILD